MTSIMIIFSVFFLLSLTANVNSQTILVSNYSSVLSAGDGTYTRPGSANPNHYYEAIQIIVDTSGYYDISSLSPTNLDTHGYLYNGTFDPLNPNTNQAAHDDDGAGNNQFKLPVFLEAGVPYTLVVTTHVNGAIGSYSLVASGPGNVQFTPIDPAQLITTTSTSTRPSIIISNYSNALTVNSQNYSRESGAGFHYYYQAIEVRVDTTGTYTFKSSGAISDTYGYLYQGNFYPFYTSINLITKDDDGAGNNQFRIIATLRSDITYILVFTTYQQSTTGSYNIEASGPGDVTFTPININT